METRQISSVHLNSNCFINNENVVLKFPGSAFSQHKSLTNSKAGKTPAATTNKKRRAFGDISNRKLDGSTVRDTKNGTPSVKYISISSNTTKGKVLKESSLSKVGQQQKVQEQRIIVSEFPKATTNRKVGFTLPQKETVEIQKDSIIQNSLHEEIVTTNIHVEQSFDEIQSAGRTWAQQKANGDHDDDDYDDDASLDGAKTVREDFMKILADHREHQIRMIQEEDDETEKYLDTLFSSWLSNGIGEGTKLNENIQNCN